MRISTVAMQRLAINSILNQQSELSRTQLQVSTGNRIINPSDDPRGTPWMKKEKPFKSVMSNKWTNFTSGGELGTTTGVKSHGIYASKVDVTTDEQNQSTYSAADYGYGNDSQEAPPPPAPPAQQQFDPNMYGYGTGYEPAPAPYTDPNYTYPYGGYGYGAGGYY